MSQLEINKNRILDQLQRLCAHCGAGAAHSCPLQDIKGRILAIKGVPLIVNNEFRGVIWR